MHWLDFVLLTVCLSVCMFVILAIGYMLYAHNPTVTTLWGIKGHSESWLMWWYYTTKFPTIVTACTLLLCVSLGSRGCFVSTEEKEFEWVSYMYHIPYFICWPTWLYYQLILLFDYHVLLNTLRENCVLFTLWRILRFAILRFKIKIYNSSWIKIFVCTLR